MDTYQGPHDPIQNWSSMILTTNMHYSNFSCRILSFIPMNANYHEESSLQTFRHICNPWWIRWFGSLREQRRGASS